jgi:hypothetical protein
MKDVYMIYLDEKQMRYIIHYIHIENTYIQNNINNDFTLINAEKRVFGSPKAYTGS